MSLTEQAGRASEAGRPVVTAQKPITTTSTRSAVARSTGSRVPARIAQGRPERYLVPRLRVLPLSEDPEVAIVVDGHEQVRGFLPQLDESIGEGLLVLDDCEGVRCTAGE